MSDARAPILVVEDNPTALKMFRVTLEAEGYRVLAAADGRSALEHAEREVPAMVLQDLVLPDCDGLELAHAIRALPSCQDVPIVVMSGFRHLLDGARAELGTFNASLIKPVPRAVLIEAVRRFLPTPAAAVEAFGRGKSVLIVDDDPTQLKLARIRFLQVGFVVTTALDGPSAMAAATASPPDVVVCDVLMPDVDGYELCVLLRKVPSLAAVPVVLVSAHYGGDRDERLARAAGANALVTRSPGLQETLGAVRTSLAGVRVVPATDPEFSKHHADRVSAQLERQARAHEAIVARADLQTAQLSVLAGIADALARSEDVATALADVVAACLDAGGMARGALFLADRQDRLILSFATGFAAADAGAVADLFGARALLERADRGLIAPASQCLPEDEAAAFLARAGVTAAVVVPILGDARRFGALMLGADAVGISEHDVATFGRAIAAHLAQALDLAAAFARLRDAAEASRVLSSSLDVHATLAAFGRLATAQLAQLSEVCIGAEPPVLHRCQDLPAAAAAVLDELGRGYPRAPVLPNTAGPAPGQRSVLIADLAPVTERVAEDADHHRLLDELQVRTLLVVPLIAAGHHLGTASFARVGRGAPFLAVDIATAEDLTQRAAIAIDNARLYDASRQASVAKDEFLATVSHELRSPLNAILGWAQMLARGEPGVPAERAARAIERNALAQAGLIEDLLDMSRMVAGTIRLALAEVDLLPVIDAAVESVRPHLGSRRIVLPDAAPLPAIVTGDARRLHQVVTNLLTNAVKFTQADGHIALKVARTDDEVTLTVVDDGIGIDPSFLPFVFERFRQADGSASRAHGGLGLGLAIARHLMELHGGTLTADSDGLGLGARFTASLRRQARATTADSSPVPAAPRPADAQAQALGGLRVLVVDDESDAREMMVLFLEAVGASAQGAASATEAFSALSARRPDVLLSDLGMPGEDGYSLIRRVRALSNEDGGTIPAIAVSGFAAPEDRQRALDAGFQMHVAKPVNLGVLLTAIRSLVATPAAARHV